LLKPCLKVSNTDRREEEKEVEANAIKKILEEKKSRLTVG